MADQPKLFPPSPELSKSAYIQSLEEYEAQYKRSIEDPEGYWAERAEDALVWTKKWDKVLDWSFDPVPYIKWFEGGELNASYNCLDRHVEAGKGDKPALIFEGDPGDTMTYTFKELLDEVSKFANVLKKHGVKKGDRVALYLPMIAQLPVVMLACARLGAIHMRHEEIHQDQVGAILLRLRHRLHAVGGLPCDRMARQALHNATECLAGRSNVVDNRDSHVGSPIRSTIVSMNVSSWKLLFVR